MSIVEMKVPTIGESVTEVTLSQWLKNNGDYVELDEPICEFESDKATLEFPAEAAGKLIHVAEEGDDLEIGALVAKVDTSVEKEGDESQESGDESQESGDESREKGDESQESGDESREKGDESQEKEGKEEKKGEPATATSEKESPAKGHASPAAAKLMRENDLKKEEIEGTGKDGRITKGDVQKAIQAKEEGAKEGNKAKEEPQEEKKKEEQKEQPQPSGRSKEAFSRETRRERMSRMRRTIASRLVSAKNNTAMLTTFNEIDMSAVMKMRKQYQEQFVEKHGIKLGFMSIFAKACAQVLMEMPEVNARLDEKDLVYHDYVDISIAISTPNGLVVPPVHNVESLQYHEVEYKIKELADKARNGTLSLEEMQGGTFTITNGGIFGSMMSTPILNEPQSAILGMHNIVNRPIAVDGEIVIRPMMYVALSYDHRVIDGSSSVTFLVKVKRLIEDPVLLLMNL